MLSLFKTLFKRVKNEQKPIVKLWAVKLIYEKHRFLLRVEAHSRTEAIMKAKLKLINKFNCLEAGVENDFSNN